LNFPESRAYLFANVIKIYTYGQQGDLEPATMSLALERLVKERR
jgi:hypothetical protein